MSKEINLHSLFSELPFSTTLFSGEFQTVKWAKEIMLYYVVQGSVQGTQKGKKIIFKKDSLLIFNSYEGHELVGMDKTTVVILFESDQKFFNNYVGFNHKVFYVGSRENYIDKEEFKNIKYTLAIILKNFYSSEETAVLTLLEASINLMKNLINGFSRIKSDVSTEIEVSGNERMERIVRYIDENYHNKITLADIAEQEYISVHYLSKYFKSKMGIGFNNYLNQIRLNNSMGPLINTRDSILQIAIDSGFPNAKSYTSVFKNAYSLTPHAYRKYFSENLKMQKNSNVSITSEVVDAIKSFVSDNIKAPSTLLFPMTINHIIDGRITKSEMLHFNKVIYFDFVYDGLNSNWQSNLEKIQDDLNFNYIKFRGIFTRGMYFYDSQENVYNWFNVDNLMDFFIGINLKPFIELTYKPSEHSLNTWYELLESFLAHCVNRYGMEQLKTWNFEIASEDRRYESSINLYTKTLKRLRSKFKDLRLGILFIPADDFEERNFLINFKDQDLKFMSVQLDEEIFQKKTSLCFELFYNIRIGMGLETYFMKTNCQSYFNDTCGRAAKFVKDSLMLNKVSLQVPFIDNIRNKKMFNGSSGLITYNGLKKPIYNAYFLMNKLQGKLVDSGDNFIFVKGLDRYTLMLYNYKDHKPNESKDLHQYLEFYNYYMEKRSNEGILIDLKIFLENGKYQLKRYNLSCDYGSLFDSWIKMGSPDNMIEEDIDILKSKEKMDLKISTREIKSELHIKEQVLLEQIILYEIKRINLS